VKHWFSTGSVIWVILHIVMFITGVALMDSESLAEQIGDGAADAVGSSLIATAVAGIILFIHVRRSDALQDQILLLNRIGLVSVFEKRAANIKHEYDARLANAKEIDVIGWGLSSFREDYGDQFTVWAAKAKVRILLVDPDFPSENASIADIRDGEEARPQGDIRRHVEAFQRKVVEAGLAENLNFHVRLMKSIPAINLLRADDEIFWGPYLMKSQSRNTPTLLVRRGGFLFSALKDHFEAVWDRSA